MESLQQQQQLKQKQQQIVLLLQYKYQIQFVNPFWPKTETSGTAFPPVTRQIFRARNFKARVMQKTLKTHKQQINTQQKQNNKLN